MEQVSSADTLWLPRAKQLHFRISASVRDGIAEVKHAIETSTFSDVDEPQLKHGPGQAI
jgi:hypothetical protein